MTIIILKKVTFELGKDVEKDVFPLVTSVGQRTSFSISMPSSKFIIFLILFIPLANMTLSTWLILAVCRTCVISELRDDLAHHRVSLT